MREAGAHADPVCTAAVAAEHCPEVLVKYDAKPCDPPSKEGLGLLVGDQITAWTLF